MEEERDGMGGKEGRGRKRGRQGGRVKSENGLGEKESEGRKLEGSAR